MKMKMTMDLLENETNRNVGTEIELISIRENRDFESEKPKQQYSEESKISSENDVETARLEKQCSLESETSLENNTEATIIKMDEEENDECPKEPPRTKLGRPLGTRKLEKHQSCIVLHSNSRTDEILNFRPKFDRAFTMQEQVCTIWEPVFRIVESNKLDIQNKMKDKWVRKVFILLKRKTTHAHPDEVDGRNFVMRRASKYQRKFLKVLSILPTPEGEVLNRVDSQIESVNVDYLCAWASQLSEESAYKLEVNQGIDKQTFIRLIQEYPKQCDQYMSQEEFENMIKQYLDRTDYKGMKNLKKGVYVLAYAEECRWFPPPPFTVISFLIQLCIFIYHVLYLKINFPDYKGNVALCSVFLLNPHRRWELWRFFTYSWVHDGYFHVLTNLIVLLFIGLPLELTHKWWRVTIVYLSGILCASMSVSIFDSKIALAGSSGGDYALVGAHLASLILNWREDNAIVVQQVGNYERTRAVKAKPIRIFRLLFVLLLMVVDTGVTIHSKLQDQGNNTSNMAHFTGCLAGIIIGIQIMKNRRSERWERILKWVFFIMTIILVITGIVLINEKFQYFRFAAIPPEDIPVDDKDWNISEKLCQDIMYKNIRDNCSDLHWPTFRYYCPLDQKKI